MLSRAQRFPIDNTYGRKFFLRGGAMYQVGLDDTPSSYSGSNSGSPMGTGREGTANFSLDGESQVGSVTNASRASGQRRTPRRSLILILPDNHFVSAEILAEGLPPTEDHELVDVIVACAGEPASLAALTRRVRDIQVLLAPAGTSPRNLRELAIRQSPGDIVTLLSGAVLPAPTRELPTFTTV
jgi:hypothetical protein